MVSLEGLLWWLIGVVVGIDGGYGLTTVVVGMEVEEGVVVGSEWCLMSGWGKGKKEGVMWCGNWKQMLKACGGG